MNDEGFKWSEEFLNDLEKKIDAEYTQASKEMTEKVQEHFSKFKVKDEKKRKDYESGKITKAEYTEWRRNQMLIGNRYIALRDTLAQDLTNVDQIAMKYASDAMIDVYALNMNYETYCIEHDLRLDTSFTLYNHDAVERLIKENPDLLPRPKVDIPKDLRWNRAHIQSAITQGILQGESIPKIAKRLQNVTGMDKRAAIRNARTAITSAQNGGRLDSMKRAQQRGIGIKKGWMATLDARTRDSHAVMDGEVVELDKPFSNGLMRPADPHGEPSQVYNCRCRLTHEYDKYKTDWSNLANRNTEKLGNMSYQEWKDKHKQNVVVSKGTSKVIKSNKEYQEESAKMLKKIYENHRIQNNMTSVPAAELPDDFFNKAHYGNMDSESVKAFNDTIANLSQKYDTTLAEIRLMTKDEYMGRRNVFAFVYHDYRMDVSTLVINPAKCGKYEKLTERIAELIQSNYTVNIDESLVGQYVATHEFAHTLLNMQDSLDAKYNWLGADYAKIKEARNEIEKVYSDYLKNKEALEKEYKKYELDFLNNFNMESAEKSKTYKEQLDAMTISKYGDTNSDEFMAECFALKQLGGSDNEYADRIMDIIEKHFGR